MAANSHGDAVVSVVTRRFPPEHPARRPAAETHSTALPLHLANNWQQVRVQHHHLEATVRLNLQLCRIEPLTGSDPAFMQFLSFPLHCPLHTQLPSAPERPKGDGTPYNPPGSATARPPKRFTSAGSSSKAPRSAGTSQQGYGVSCPYLVHPAPRVEHFPAQEGRG